MRFRSRSELSFLSAVLGWSIQMVDDMIVDGGLGGDRLVDWMYRSM